MQPFPAWGSVPEILNRLPSYQPRSRSRASSKPSRNSASAFPAGALPGPSAAWSGGAPPDAPPQPSEAESTNAAQTMLRKAGMAYVLAAALQRRRQGAVAGSRRSRPGGVLQRLDD